MERVNPRESTTNQGRADRKKDKAVAMNHVWAPLLDERAESDDKGWVGQLRVECMRPEQAGTMREQGSKAKNLRAGFQYDPARASAWHDNGNLVAGLSQLTRQSQNVLF